MEEAAVDSGESVLDEKYLASPNPRSHVVENPSGFSFFLHVGRRHAFSSCYLKYSTDVTCSFVPILYDRVEAKAPFVACPFITIYRVAARYLSEQQLDC